MSAAARCAVRWISSRSCRGFVPDSKRLRRISHRPWMIVSRVVEIVSHAAGQAADRVHLLSLQERLLSPRHFLGGHLDLAEEARVLERRRGLRCERGRDRLVLFRETGQAPRPDRQHAGHALADLDRHAEVRAVAEPLDGAAVGRDQPRVVGHVVEPERRAHARDETAEALADLDSRRRHRFLGVAQETGDDELVTLHQAKSDGFRLEDLAARGRDRPEELLDRLDPRQLVAHVQQRLEPGLIGALRLEQLGVADRDTRLRGEPGEPGLVPVGQRSRRAVVHHEQPFDARLGLDRHRQRGFDALHRDERLRVVPEARVVRVVVGPERPAGQQHVTGEPLARHDLLASRRGHPAPVADDHRLRRQVAGGDDAEVGPAQLAPGVTRVLQDRVEVERGGDLACQLREDLGLAASALRILEEASFSSAIAAWSTNACARRTSSLS